MGFNLRLTIKFFIEFVPNESQNRKSQKSFVPCTRKETYLIEKCINLSQNKIHKTKARLGIGMGEVRPDLEEEKNIKTRNNYPKNSKKI